MQIQRLRWFDIDLLIAAINRFAWRQSMQFATKVELHRLSQRKCIYMHLTLRGANY